MSQRRMLNKSISISEQVAGLSIEAQLFYTWSIAHADDFGLLPASAKKLKGMVVPYWDKLVKDIEKLVREILSTGLWIEIEFYDTRWFCFPKWLDFQDLRRDIKPKLYANITVEWDNYETIKNQARNNLLQFVPNPSGSVAKDKISKDKISEGKLPSQIAKEFLESKDYSSLGDNWLDKINKLGYEEKKNFEFEIDKFVSYWTEPNKSGTKQRWELEKTFEIGRRLSTWFKNYQQFNARKYG